MYLPKFNTPYLLLFTIYVYVPPHPYTHNNLVLNTAVLLLYVAPQPRQNSVGVLCIIRTYNFFSTT